jgi:hypothetical protein
VIYLLSKDMLDFLTAWKHLDFVTAWKAISIALTGAFGILGLVKDFKDKETNRVTVWGYVSLGGILLSSGLGVVAQLKESQDDSVKALTLATTTSHSLIAVQRLLTTIGDPKVEIEYEFDCDAKNRDTKYDKFCKTVKAVQEQESRDKIPDPYALQDYYREGSDLANWKDWPILYEDKNTFVRATLSFFIDQETAQRFLTDVRTIPDLQLFIKSDRKELGTDLLEASVDINSISLISRMDAVQKMTSTESMVSIRDLPGATVLVTSDTYGNGFEGLRPVRATITTQQGLRVIIPRFDKYKNVFRYVFPRSSFSPQSNESSAAPSPGPQGPAKDKP